MGVRLLGALRLPTEPVDGQRLEGISGLAWDQDEGLLYALSDLGRVFHLRPRFNAGQLTDLQRLAAYALRERSGKPLGKFHRDAEGLALLNGADGVTGNGQLLVSFEIDPRLRRYTPDGAALGDLALPAELRTVRRYSNPNTGLEAVTVHPRWGVLLAPERPLRGRPPGAVTVYSLGDQNRRWRYPLHPAAGSSLVAFEALADGTLLTLERAYVGLTRPLIISLRRARLGADGAAAEVSDVAVFDTSKGWLLDNFEALAVHQGRRFFIASDDNSSFLQSTLLVYLELIEAP